jgi:cobalamin biosynthesis protein CobD/CbiB
MAMTFVMSSPGTDVASSPPSHLNPVAVSVRAFSLAHQRCRVGSMPISTRTAIGLLTVAAVIMVSGGLALIAMDPTSPLGFIFVVVGALFTISIVTRKRNR